MSANPYRRPEVGTVMLEKGERRRKQEGKGEPYHEPASKQPFTSAHLRPVVERLQAAARHAGGRAHFFPAPPLSLACWSGRLFLESASESMNEAANR